MKQPDVIYFVESAAKELDVACAVKHLVEERYGLRVAICSYKRRVPHPLKRVSPALIVVPTCYAADAWGIRRHLPNWPRATYLNLAWEELFCKANQTWKQPRGAFATKHVLHHVWSEIYGAFLTSHGVVPEHVIVNGHPGYALYEEPYRHYFPDRASLARRHSLDPHNRWVLFPENYGWAFYSDGNVEARLRGGMDPKLPPMLRECCRESLKTVLCWCAEAAQGGELEIIIRPRPSTRGEVFEDFVREAIGTDFGRLRLIKEGPVQQWILASDVVLSSFSTTLIEAAIAGKPAYMVEPLPLPDPLWTDWYEHATAVRTREAFLGACLDRNAAGHGSPLENWARAILMSRGDALSNLADYIGRLCQGELKRPPVPSPEILPAARVNGRGLVRQLKNVLRPFSDAYETLRGGPTMHEQFRFSRSDVRDRTRKWREVLSRRQPSGVRGCAVVATG